MELIGIILLVFVVCGLLDAIISSNIDDAAMRKRKQPWKGTP